MGGPATKATSTGTPLAGLSSKAASMPARAPVAANAVNPLPSWILAGQPDVELRTGATSLSPMLKQDTLDFVAASAQPSRQSTSVLSAHIIPHSHKSSTTALIPGSANANANVAATENAKPLSGASQPTHANRISSSSDQADRHSRPAHRHPHIPRPHMHHHAEEEDENDLHEDMSDENQPRLGQHHIIDEWDELVGNLSPVERQRLQKHVRQVVANSGSYWQKRKQRRRLRKQLRFGPRYADPDASFQALDRGHQAAETFGDRTFTGRTTATDQHLGPYTGCLQNPDAPQFPFSLELGQEHDFATGRRKNDELSRGHAHTPAMLRIVALATSAGRTPDAEKSPARLKRMSGLRSASFDENVQRPSELDHHEPDDQDVYTRRQALEPRWNTPWTAELDAGLTQPEVIWGIVPKSRGPFGLFTYRLWRNRRRADPEKEEPHELSVPDNKGFGIGFGTQSSTLSMDLLSWTWWHQFLLKNPFVPLILRVLSISFVSAALAVGVRIRRSLQHQGAPVSSMGVSPLLAIIYGPITLLHALGTLYIEYFGRPLGLWSVKSKLIGTSVEVIFVGLWASELSLTFDNFYDFKEHRNAPIFNPNGTFSARYYKNRPYLARLQRGLICVVFVAVFVNMSALIVRRLSLRPSNLIVHNTG